MFVLLKSRTGSKVAYVGSKTRSLGQMLEKPCTHSRGQIFSQIIMKLGQNFRLMKSWMSTKWFMESQKLGHYVKSKKNFVYAVEARFSV